MRIKTKKQLLLQSYKIIYDNTHYNIKAGEELYLEYKSNTLKIKHRNDEHILTLKNVGDFTLLVKKSVFTNRLLFKVSDSEFYESKHTNSTLSYLGSIIIIFSFTFAFLAILLFLSFLLSLYLHS